MRLSRLLWPLFLVILLVKGNYGQAQVLDFYDHYTRQAKPCRMYTKVIDQPWPRVFKVVEAFMEERYLWVKKNPAGTVLTGRSSRTWSGTDGEGRKTGGKKITHTVISFEPLGANRTALHFCYYVNGKPENDPERFAWLVEEIEAKLTQP